MKENHSIKTSRITKAVIPLLIRMMVADGKIMKNEIKSLSEMIDTLSKDLDKESKALSLSEILPTILQKTDEEVISDTLPLLHDEEKEEALLLLFGMAGIDGSFHKKEKDFISKVQLAFGYDQSKIDGVLDLI